MMTKYEFFGPPGALFITLTITPITYFADLLITPEGSPPRAFLRAPLTYLTETLTSPDSPVFFAPHTFLYYILYFVLLVVLLHLLPGPVVPGTLLRDGTRLLYKLNAFPSALLILAFCGICTYLYGPNWVVWTYLWEYNLSLVSALNLFSILLSTFLYLYSHRPGTHILAAGGQTNNVLYDWFIGRELNPRPFSFLSHSFDLKAFCEHRPGLLLWVILNLSNIMAQLRLHPTLHSHPTLSILLPTAFQLWYVLDSLYNESAILTTMDITTDGFGHMLVFGDLAWVPVMYSLQTRYLALHPHVLSPLSLALILSVQAVGYWIFRASNSQKNLFRTNPAHPSVRALRTIDTKRGTRLIVSGWWGTARHINYLGDWIMAWAWCLPTGFGTPLTYFYVVYFAILLVHRERRDDEACAKKYGGDWERYKRLVRWRIVPWVY